MHSRSFLMRMILNSLLVAVLVLGNQSPVIARPQATTFTVDTATDAHDSNLSDGICNNGVDGCNLRAAVEQAFSVASSGNPVTILFWSSGSVLHNLTLGSINWAASYVTLDGQSLGITIDGSGMAAGQNLIAISGDHNTIRNLTLRGARNDALRIGDFAGVGAGNDNLAENLFIIGSGASGVYVYGGSNNGGQRNLLQNNAIGVAGWAASSCVVGEANGGNGILIEAGAHSTRVVTSRIVCNSYNGIYIQGNSGLPTGVDINNNDIGVRADSDMGNGLKGILVDHASRALIRGNVISGNGDSGVGLAGATYVTMTYNHIGVSSNGSSVIPNALCGVAIYDSAANNLIGGPNPTTDKNVISGNGTHGICLSDGAATNTIESNIIGLNSMGTAAVPNGGAGMWLSYASDNVIGSSAPQSVQYISGNTRAGIYLENSNHNSIGAGNSIGRGSDGSRQGNQQDGVYLKQSTNTLVVPDYVVYNVGAGIVVTGDVAVENQIAPVNVYSNGGLPVDLGGDGQTPNGSRSAPGPNNWQPYPVITASSGNVITGTTCANCKVAIYGIYGNPGMNGGGGYYITMTTASAAGVWNVTLANGLTGRDISMIACHGTCTSSGNSSEMSPVYLLFAPVVGRRY